MRKTRQKERQFIQYWSTIKKSFYEYTPFIRKFYYGDIPEDGGRRCAIITIWKDKNEWPLWEVLFAAKTGWIIKHCGSLHAADARMAIENARDVYTRRMEGESIWVVESKYITASNPEEVEWTVRTAKKIKYTGILLFIICLMKLITCNWRNMMQEQLITHTLQPCRY